MNMYYKKLSIFLLLLLISGLIGSNGPCKLKGKKRSSFGNTQTSSKEKESGKNYVHKIKSTEEFNNILENAGTKLLVIDMYADWCGPCKRLAPILEEVAKKNPDKADFYKVNTDEFRNIASMFNVRGIPHVEFLKEKKVVLTLVVLYPKVKYINTINQILGSQ